LRGLGAFYFNNTSEEIKGELKLNINNNKNNNNNKKNNNNEHTRRTHAHTNNAKQQSYPILHNNEFLTKGVTATEYITTYVTPKLSSSDTRLKCGEGTVFQNSA